MSSRFRLFRELISQLLFGVVINFQVLGLFSCFLYLVSPRFRETFDARLLVILSCTHILIFVLNQLYPRNVIAITVTALIFAYSLLCLSSLCLLPERSEVLTYCLALSSFPLTIILWRALDNARFR